MMINMKELDCIEVIVEKKKYTEDGVHKGMTGWICYDKCVDGYWLVNFPQYGDKPDIATISVHESDMVKIAALNVQINEQIRKQFERNPNQEQSPRTTGDFIYLGRNNRRSGKYQNLSKMREVLKNGFFDISSMSS